ncbi:MAG: hypothetical protein D6744_15695 [Planctomycetota bacterium]|nr:MAG: hypothetical protein D6744_15695 [Planctomycetota bacterium]
MDAKQIRELLPTYADGELDAERARHVEAALADSDELRAELERWRALRRCANRAIAGEPVPIDLIRRVRSAIRRRPSRTYRIAASFVAVAAALALVVVYWPRPDVSSTGAASGGSAVVAARPVSADRFVEIHDRCAITHKHDALTLAGKHARDADEKVTQAVGFPVRVPDLRSAGFVLAGGCTCFRVRDTRAAHLFYRAKSDPEQMLSYFVVDHPLTLENCTHCRSRCGTRHYEQVSVGDEVVLHWSERSHSFAIVGEMDVDRLDAIAGQVRTTLLLLDSPAVALVGE